MKTRGVYGKRATTDKVYDLAKAEVELVEEIYRANVASAKGVLDELALIRLKGMIDEVLRIRENS